MIKIRKVKCKWCHRPIHAVLRGAVYVARCSVCADEFVVGELCLTTKQCDTVEVSA